MTSDSAETGAEDANKYDYSAIRKDGPEPGPQLACYQCGELTPAEQGALCWVCRDKAQRAQAAPLAQPAYRPVVGPSKSGSTMLWWLLGVLVLILVAGGLAAYQFYQEQRSQEIVDRLQQQNDSYGMPTAVDSRVVAGLRTS